MPKRDDTAQKPLPDDAWLEPASAERFFRQGEFTAGDVERIWGWAASILEKRGFAELKAIREHLVTLHEELSYRRVFVLNPRRREGDIPESDGTPQRVAHGYFLSLDGDEVYSLGMSKRRKRLEQPQLDQAVLDVDLRKFVIDQLLYRYALQGDIPKWNAIADHAKVQIVGVMPAGDFQDFAIALLNKVRSEGGRRLRRKQMQHRQSALGDLEAGRISKEKHAELVNKAGALRLDFSDLRFMFEEVADAKGLVDSRFDTFLRKVRRLVAMTPPEDLILMGYKQDDFDSVVIFLADVVERGAVH